MIDNKICIRLLDGSLATKTVRWPTEGIDYVEQLVFGILESEGVGPVYRHLFGLKLFGKQIWLAPNAPINSIYTWSKNYSKNQGDAKLELRVRFRPSCYSRLLQEDKVAFDYVFAQIRYEFLHTEFNDERRDLVLLNHAVLGLVALDLIRHAIINDIDVKQLLKKVNKDDFVPKKAAKWQRLLLFPFADQINLQKSVQIGLERCSGDPYKAKKRFIELFLAYVAQDYSCESYDVICASESLSPIFPSTFTISSTDKSKSYPENFDKLQVRVRYYQKIISEQNNSDNQVESENLNNDEESFCVIEVRSKKRSHSRAAWNDNNNTRDSPRCERIWYQICDIENISHATLRKDIVQIARNNASPIRLKFESHWHAESFLSSIDGYYRLMKKWNFNLCREVFSPDLEYLKKNRCHGPIGYETTRRKLSHLKSSGTYLIRQCMKRHDRYFIDTILPAKTRLTIDVDHDKTGRFYKKVGFTCNRSLRIVLKTGQDQYPSLKSLINDLEIRVLYDIQRDEFTQQLKHGIQPEEDDDYPALLLSMSKKKLTQFEQNGTVSDSMDQFPVVIPTTTLQISVKNLSQSPNGTIVNLATFNKTRDVVIKDQDGTYRPQNMVNSSQFTFHFCPKGHNADSLKPDQVKLTDWLFVRSPLFAETVGYILNGQSLVQEYFPLGSLDKYLAHNNQVSDVTKLSISFQLTQALLYLQDKKMIHGKIRCHNIFVVSPYPIQVKLSDPLGCLDIERDQAFIPPEYFKSAVQICIKEFYTGIDVWAFGTTLWQVFNQGNRPPSGRFANTLVKPSDCPNNIWHIIEACWKNEPADRPSPQILYRDLNDMFAWEKGFHHYLYISHGNISDHNGRKASLTPPRNITATSSLADLSSISNADSYTPIISQQELSNQNESQTHLLHSLSSSPDRNGDSLSSSAREPVANKDGDAPPLPPPRSNHSTNGYDQPGNHRRKRQFKVSSTWRSLMHIGGRTNIFVGRKWSDRDSIDEDLPPDSSSFRFNGSSLTISSCTTPSEATGFTDLPDFESISEALDRCVWHVDSSRLKLGPEEIGRGSSGVVMKGVMYEPDGMTKKVVAVKCIDKDNSNFSIHRLHDLRREFDILKDLDHKNIVKTLGYVEESYTMLIFEYVPLGSLLSCVKNMPQEDLKDLPIKKYVHDIACGMEYLESMKIVHRDLALRNILLSRDPVQKIDEVKICDFGLAQFLGTNNHYKLKTDRALPLKWYAPEAICTWIFTHKSDVWSYGVVLWEIYSGGDNPQYSGELKDLTETLKHERLKRPKDCPLDVYDLMLKCWTYDPEQRISFTQLRESLSSKLCDQQVNNSESCKV